MVEIHNPTKLVEIARKRCAALWGDDDIIDHDSWDETVAWSLYEALFASAPGADELLETLDLCEHTFVLESREP